MFGNRRFQKNGIRITKDDIKKSIKAANDRLQNANKKIDHDIVDKKESLLSIKKEIDSFNNGLKSIESEMESAKHSAVGAKAEASKEHAKLSRLKGQVVEAIANEDKAQANLINLAKESNILDKKIVKMNDDLVIVSSMKEEIKILKSDKKLELKELDRAASEAKDIKAELSKLQTDSIKKKITHKDLFAKLDAEADIKQKALEMVDGEYATKIAALNIKFSSLEESLKDKEQEAETMGSLIDKREKEFIEWESKCRQAEYMLMKAKELADGQIERSKKEIDKQKEAAKKWKVGFFEEIARVKLKKKIENIDMAGLKEAFDV